MDHFAELTGRHYHLFDYVGAPDAERVLVIMGSGAETAHETVDALTAAGEKVGVLKVRLYRPFAADAFLAALPRTVKSIAVLDRTKEPGALGEPLYSDVLTALGEALQTGTLPFAIPARGRRSLRPLLEGVHAGHGARACFDELAQADAQEPLHRRHRGRRQPQLDRLRPELDDRPTRAPSRAMFYGLGADGTVGANKNSIKIIGENTDSYAQGYFVYDSKKSRLDDDQPPALRQEADPRQLPDPGRRLRGLPPERLPREVRHAGQGQAGRSVPAQHARRGRTRSGTPCPGACRSSSSPRSLKLYVIDAYKVAAETGMGAAHQHDHADLLLRDQRRAAARRGDRRRSRTPSRRPTANAASRSCARTTRPWTAPWPTSTR